MDQSNNALIIFFIFLFIKEMDQSNNALIIFFIFFIFFFFTKN
jgi:hypothetical protein